MLPSLAYVHSKVPQDRTAHWSVGDLSMPLDPVIRLRLMTNSGKGRVACSRNSQERIGESRKLVA